MIFERAKRILQLFATQPHTVVPFNASFIQNLHLLEGSQIGQTTRLKFGLKVLPEFANAYGPMHGGAICTLIDDTTTLAIFTADEDFKMTVSVDLSVSFASVANVGDNLTIVADCNKKGRSLIFSTANIFKGDKLVALGKHTKYQLDTKIMDHLESRKKT